MNRLRKMFKCGMRHAMQQVVEKARRILEQESEQTEEKFYAVVGEINAQCNEIIESERQQLQRREANIRHNLDKGDGEIILPMNPTCDHLLRL